MDQPNIQPQQDDQDMPDFMKQPQTERQVVQSAGSPEMPTIIDNGSESAAEQAIEYGDEALKNLETQISPELKNIERKEAQQQQPQQPPPQTKQLNSSDEPVGGVTTQTSGVRYFGYPIGQNALADLPGIPEKKEKGNIKSTEPWLMVFLDRLLRKQAERSKN